MSKKIVIDKEKVERSGHSELIKTAISLLIKHGVATELSTDESIYDRAKKYAESLGISKTDRRYNQYIQDAIKDYTQGATEQSLIEQMKAKEWINISDKKPDYYKVVLCQDVEGNICACWRACSDDLEDMYTINKSDNLLENVVKWRTI